MARMLFGARFKKSKLGRANMEEMKMVQKAYESEATSLKKVQNELAEVAKRRTQYMSQLHENETVKKELDLQCEDAPVFKVIGPVLVKQDLVEAKSNVGKRLDWIKTELKRTDDNMEDLMGKQEAHHKKMQNLMATFQQQQNSLQNAARAQA